MRVGLLIYGSLDTLSGGYLYDRKLVAYLQSQGEEVKIISLPWRNYPRHLVDNFNPTLRAKLQNPNLDILIQDELNHPSLFWLNHRIKGYFPIISLVHHLRCSELHPPWQNHFYRWVEHQYLESIDGFIFNSHTTRDAVKQITNMRDRPWVVATPGGNRFNPDIGIKEIRDRTMQPGPLRLIFLGNVISRKGLHTLVRALASLPGGTFTLDVIGALNIDPVYTRSILKQIKAHQLTQFIRLRGKIDNHSLADLLCKSHIMVLPSSYEGFGIANLEGMGFGLPAISSTQGGASEIIISGENGFLIDTEDSASLVKILEDLHKNRQKLVDLSLSALKQYDQFPVWEQSMAKIHSFLKRLTIDKS
jgi:glycosyltransferase involved in cell wall biosynthesis